MKQHFSLDPDITFLNHGSFGACPLPVQAVQTEMRALLERQPVRFYEQEAQPRLRDAREAVANLMGADPADLAFVPNATTGVNVALNSFDLAPGDEILFTNQEYNACGNVVRFIADANHAESVVVEIPFPLQSDDQIVEAILAKVTPRTRVALIDHITSQTALIFPVERIVAELKQRGVETVVDGAHALGMTPINVTAIGAAFYTTNAHKWLCAPKVAAILHARSDRQENARPTVISHGANAPIDDTTSRFRLEFDWPGTADITAYLATPAAINFLSKVLDGGIEAVMKHNHDLVLAGRDLVCDALGIAAPAPDDMLGAMSSIPLPDSASSDPLPGPFDLDPLKIALWDQHRIEIPIMPWPHPPHRLLRLSAQIYNTIDDYRRLADVLPTLLSSN